MTDLETRATDFVRQTGVPYLVALEAIQMVGDAETDASAHMSRDVSREPRDRKGEWTSGGAHPTVTQDDIDSHVGSSQRKRTPVPVKEQSPTLSAKAELAKQFATRIDSRHQRYSEEHNEPILAKMIGGTEFADNEPIDVAVIRDGIVQHGIELKTMLTNKANKLTMHADALQRKAKWVTENHAPFHTVVFDDSNVFNAKGDGQHDDTKRVIYYKRGAGSFRIASMHKVADPAELTKLLNTPDGDLPAGAKPLPSYVPPKPRKATANNPEPTGKELSSIARTPASEFSWLDPRTWFTKESIKVDANFSGHDVSSEARDQDGKWTTSGGSGIQHDFNDHWKQLTPEERHYVEHYTVESSINDRLRNTDKVPLIPSRDKEVAAIDAAMAKSTLSEDTVLFRGLEYFNGARKLLSPGTVFEDKGYQSTSAYMEEAASMGADYLLRIHAKKGSHALAIGPNSAIDQDEVLLPRNSKLRIQSVKVSNYQLHNTEVHMKIIDAELL